MPGDRYARAVPASPSYAPVGGTAHPELPSGYRTHEPSVDLGRGDAVFARAREALTSRTMHGRYLRAMARRAAGEDR